MYKSNTLTVYGNPFIGIYAKTNDKIMLVGESVADRFFRYKDLMKVEIIKTTLCDSELIGIYCALNSNGIIVSKLTSEDEIKKLKEIGSEYGLVIEVLQSKFTAVGNNIVVNDYGAIVNMNLESEDIKKIKDTFNVEVDKFTIGGYQTVGAALLATNKGFIAHPFAKEEELEKIKSIMKTDGGIGTANGGVPFPSISMLANSYNFISGDKTTGYELHRINECLGFI